MSDYSELQRAAENACSYNENDWFTPENLNEVVEQEDAAFISAASPSVILGLIAENIELKRKLSNHENPPGDLVDKGSGVPT